MNFSWFFRKQPPEKRDLVALLAQLDEEISQRQRQSSDEEFGRQLEALTAAFAELLASGPLEDDPRFGPRLPNILGGHGNLYLVQLLNKKEELRGKFSLTGFAQAIAQKNNEEEKLWAPLPQNLSHEYPIEAITALQNWWRQRYKTELAISLVGVRQLDGFLRSQYFLRHIDSGFFVAAGCLLGEVGRGLFGGTWLAQSPIERSVLRYPELDYKPIGRIYRMMTECPEGEPLDEYLRLIPQARRELRKSLTPEEC